MLAAVCSCYTFQKKKKKIDVCPEILTITKKISYLADYS